MSKLNDEDLKILKGMVDMARKNLELMPEVFRQAMRWQADRAGDEWVAYDLGYRRGWEDAYRRLRFPVAPVPEDRPVMSAEQIADLQKLLHWILDESEAHDAPKGEQ